MTRIALVLAAAAIAAAPLSASAFDIQDDIKACGAAAEEAGLIQANAYTLRFVSDQGNRNRTLVVDAITGPSQHVTVTCKMKRSQVLSASAGE
jgi:hypothetical protein